MRFNFKLSRIAVKRYCSQNPGPKHESKDAFKFKAENCFSHLHFSKLFQDIFMLKILNQEFTTSFEAALNQPKSLIVLDQTIFKNCLKILVLNKYVGGETLPELITVALRLKGEGIGTIMDYAVESDINELQEASESTGLKTISGLENMDLLSRYQAIEAASLISNKYSLSDTILVHIQAIDSATKVSNDGFIAIKLTAIMDPSSLKKTSEYLTRLRSFFDDCPKNELGLLKENVGLFLSKVGVDLTDVEFLTFMEKAFGVDPSRGLCFYDIVQSFHPTLPLSLLYKCNSSNNHFLKEEDVYKNIKLRKDLFKLIQYAKDRNVKILIDSEQCYYKKAVDLHAVACMREFNTPDTAFVYHTYQCYLKSTLKTLSEDIAYSHDPRKPFCFGVKLVRGAYMDHERNLANKLSIPSPVHETYEDTTESFHKAIETLMPLVPSKKANLVIASHNEASIEKAAELMKDLGIQPSDVSVCMAQLYGMAEALTYQLVKANHRTFNYVPFGPFKKVLPYLLRRAQENSSITEKNIQIQSMLLDELKSRLWIKKF